MSSASRPPSRVVTFNIGRGAVGGRWGAASPGATFTRLDEVAETLARLDPAVAALQEVHEGDVPELVRLLAEEHGRRVHPAFAAALPAGHPRLARLAKEDATRGSAYGLAVLSRAPVTSARVRSLAFDGWEARVAQVVTTSLGATPVTVVNVHLSTAAGRPRDLLLGRSTPQRVQTEEVLRLAAGIEGPVVVLGDWNQEALVLRLALRRAARARASSASAASGASGSEGRLALASDRWRGTTILGNGFDHVLVGGGLQPRYHGVERTTVSDHRPVLVVLDVPVRSSG